MVGVDVPNAFWSLEERRASPGEPYAVKTMLGWSIRGILWANFQALHGGSFVRSEVFKVARISHCVGLLKITRRISAPQYSIP